MVALASSCALPHSGAIDFASGRDGRSAHQSSPTDTPRRRIRAHFTLSSRTVYASARWNRGGNAPSSNSQRLSLGNPSGKIDASRFKLAHTCRASLLFVSIRQKADCRKLLGEQEERVYTLYKNNNPSKPLVARIPSFGDAGCKQPTGPLLSPISVLAWLCLEQCCASSNVLRPSVACTTPGIGKARPPWGVGSAA
jgi:hypothetical protein